MRWQGQRIAEGAIQTWSLVGGGGGIDRGRVVGSDLSPARTLIFSPLVHSYLTGTTDFVFDSSICLTAFSRVCQRGTRPSDN